MRKLKQQSWKLIQGHVEASAQPRPSDARASTTKSVSPLPTAPSVVSLSTNKGQDLVGLWAPDPEEDNSSVVFPLRTHFLNLIVRKQQRKPKWAILKGGGEGWLYLQKAQCHKSQRLRNYFRVKEPRGTGRPNTTHEPSLDLARKRRCCKWHGQSVQSALHLLRLPTALHARERRAFPGNHTEVGRDRSYMLHTTCNLGSAGSEKIKRGCMCAWVYMHSCECVHVCVHMCHMPGVRACAHIKCVFVCGESKHKGWSKWGKMLATDESA